MKSPISRLALRIYLVALTPIVAIIGVVLVLSTLRPGPTPPRFEIESAHKAAMSISSAFGDAKALERALADIYAEATAYAADGHILATNTDPPLPPLPADDASKLFAAGPDSHDAEIIGPGIPSLIGVRMNVPTEAGSYLQFRTTRAGHGGPRGRGSEGPRHGPPSDPVVWMVLVGLLATAAAAVVLARSLTKPLTTLAAAATRFGEGDLSTRVRLARKDELGELGASFDAMAERVAGLVRSQQELLANVSHELRTPLARIRVALDIADEGDAATARDALKEITEDLAEIEQLVSEVLTTARLDLAAGRAGTGLRVGGEVLDLAAIVEKSAARFQAAGPGRALELATDALGEGGGVFVKGDAVLLRRAFDNLLDNARSYSEATTTVTIAARRRDSRVEVAVIDRGIGVVAEDLPHLATPFFRTDRSRSRRSGGLGLGLSLTRRIVEAHGGELAIESAVGKGTTVRVTLPVTDAPVADVA